MSSQYCRGRKKRISGAFESPGVVKPVNHRFSEENKMERN